MAEGVPEIVTVHVNVPDPDTVTPQLEIVAPELIVVVIVTLGVKPVPETTTETPLGPWVGLRVIPAALTVNVAVAASKLPSDPVAVTV